MKILENFRDLALRLVNRLENWKERLENLRWRLEMKKLDREFARVRRKLERDNERLVKKLEKVMILEAEEFAKRLERSLGRSFED